MLLLDTCFSGAGVCLAPPWWLWTRCPCRFLLLCQNAVTRCLFRYASGRWVLCAALCPLLRCALGASCCFRLLWALLVCFRSVLVRARGPAFRLGGCLLGFPAIVCTVTPIPTIASLCDTQRIRVSMVTVTGAFLAAACLVVCTV